MGVSVLNSGKKKNRGCIPFHKDKEEELFISVRIFLTRCPTKDKTEIVVFEPEKRGGGKHLEIFLLENRIVK